MGGGGAAVAPHPPHGYANAHNMQHAYVKYVKRLAGLNCMHMHCTVDQLLHALVEHRRKSLRWLDGSRSMAGTIYYRFSRSIS